ncbi:MAG: 2Fe-2S iron-sulfur cluster binding domain-containing protein [Ruminococcaceae bacterium]|nr:2Fe-2S iron-sulfur cluster binding domain-containing protein [Oscillospiraceae bacterium]
MALKIKIGLIGVLDMLKFKKMPDVREAAIAKAPANPLPKAYASNAKAALYHPVRQEVEVADIIPNGPDAKTYVLKSTNGAALAPFRAGQYISLALEIGAAKTSRAYSLCSSPEWAYDGIYHITIKQNDGGFVAPYIHENWKVGEKISITSPEGHLYYEPIRDAKKVIALGGGAGITPFMAMAYAIRDGHEDFDLTIIFGSRTEDGIVYRKELDEVCAVCDKVHVVHVLSDEEKEGFEHGFITAELIKKYAGEDEVSVFMCGPQAMYNFVDGELAKLGYDEKHVRHEIFGAIKKPWELPGYPQEAKDKTFTVTLKQCGQTYEIPAMAGEPLLVAFERAGIKAPSRCRSGECGWCRSRLLKGNVFIPEKTDGRRYADIQYGYIHPCASFPISDLEVEVPAEY